MEETKVKLDEKALEAITSKIKGEMATDVASAVKAVFEEKEKEAEAKKAEAEAIAKKELEAPNVNKMQDVEDMGKELRMVKHLKAFLNGDRATVREFNQFNLEQAKQKTGYQNAATSADGGYVVLDPEFEAEVEALSEDYGVAFREADVLPINAGSIKTNKRGSNVTMYEVGEGATITSSKMSIEQVEKALRKFAGISIGTYELSEDSAIDFWNEFTKGFAEERARIADELVFTDTKVGNEGIMHQDDIIVETVGAAITSITWDDLLNAEAAIPTKARQNMKHFMHRTVWNLLLQDKDDEGRYQALPFGAKQTPWGTPVVLVDALPTSAMVGDANEGYIVTGDLKRAKLYYKRGLVVDFSREATVTDTDSNAVNLFEQGMEALRVMTRMVHLNKFPEAFCVTGTGTVS